jgi:branched-chain amino acid transport system ATP-binding protein
VSEVGKVNPLAGLSPKIVQEVLAKIHEIRVKLGMSILLVEQNVGQALKVTDRGVVLINFSQENKLIRR